MYKIKKKPARAEKAPVLYNIIEDYSEWDPPGNVTVCAMTEPEDLQGHAKVLAESYEIPLDTMLSLLERGGVYVYPQTGLLVTRGLFTCRIDPSGKEPKQTWVLDVGQYAGVEQLVRAYGLTLEEASTRVFYRTLSPALNERLAKKNLGLDYSTPDRAIARAGDIRCIDFRKDWSPHFKRLCIMPDGRLVETGGIREFAELHGVSLEDAKRLVESGGTLEVGEGEVLACQIVNGQPSIARFNRHQYAKAKAIADRESMHLLDALSRVALQDPVLMQALKRLEQRLS